MARTSAKVWDFRLSTAAPQIMRRDTWVVELWPVSGGGIAPLESFDTGIGTEPGDAYDSFKLSVCYNWLRGVRDKYSRPDIEALRPRVAEINKANAALAAKGKK